MVLTVDTNKGKSMDSNNETVQKHVVINGPGQRSELLTERTQKGRGESGLPIGMIAIATIAILAIAASGTILYIVNNQNANESANRNANLQLASQPPVPSTAPQPAQAQQAPRSFSNPSLGPAANPSAGHASDDANMQEVATRRLFDEPDMTGVSITISEARAVLTGTVSSAATKTRAERLVKEVRGMKSVDNKIVVTG
jgi:osmotically-inducible protein OsmY